MLRSTFHLLTTMSKRKFYAVAIGRKPGIYASWNDCEINVKKFPNARYKKFDTEEEAKAFVDKCQNRNGSCPQESVIESVIEPTESTVPQAHVKHKTKRAETTHTDEPPNKKSKGIFDTDYGGSTIVYTDGGCTNNGKPGARAGIGVYWGPDHPLNVSARCPGRQTNNNAEIRAAISAIHLAKKEGIKKLTIKTDSQFMIYCVTSWIPKWKCNNWKTTSGHEVLNKYELQHLDKIINDGSVNVKWDHVRAHVGIHGNEGADQLATDGLNQPDLSDMSGKL